MKPWVIRYMAKAIYTTQFKWTLLNVSFLFCCSLSSLFVNCVNLVLGTKDLWLLFCLSTNHDPDIICVQCSRAFKQEEVSSVLQDLFQWYASIQCVSWVGYLLQLEKGEYLSSYFSPSHEPHSVTPAASQFCLLERTRELFNYLRLVLSSRPWNSCERS